MVRNVLLENGNGQNPQRLDAKDLGKVTGVSFLTGFEMKYSAVLPCATSVGPILEYTGAYRLVFNLAATDTPFRPQGPLNASPIMVPCSSCNRFDVRRLLQRWKNPGASPLFHRLGLVGKRSRDGWRCVLAAIPRSDR